MSETENGTPGVYEYYRNLRQQTPVVEQQGAWQVARYADVRQVLRDRAQFNRPGGPATLPVRIFP